jgi:hypothetical protein
MNRDEFLNSIAEILADIQKSLLVKATSYRDENSVNIDSREDFISFFTPKKP